MVDISEFFQRRVAEADLSTGANELALEADTGESYTIMDFGIDGANADTVAKITVGEESMIAFPAGDGEDTLFREDTLLDEKMSLYGYMRGHDLPAPAIQVPEGDTFALTNDTNTGTATILYQEGSQQVANPSSPGGPGTKRRVYPVTGSKTETFASSGNTRTFDDFSSRQPAEFEDFPFGEDCPANREFDLLATSLVAVNDNTSGVTVDSFRLLTEEQKPLAKEGNFVDADLAEYPSSDLEALPFTYPGKPTFTPGDELDLEVQATSGTAGGSAQIRCTHIFERRPV
jgi:hypothetical protein